MKKCFLLALLPLLTLAQSTQQIVIGQIDSLSSKILHQNRSIWVHLPQSYAKDNTRRYPVVYVLDGDEHFTSTVGITEELSTTNLNFTCPEMMVVGVLHADRGYDLTPTMPTDAQYRSIWPTAGGGETFTRFLETELIPYVTKKYPAGSGRTLIGHSLAGLLVLNTLVHHPTLFNAFICIDPSPLQWNGGQFLAQIKQALASQNFSGKSFYLGLSNNILPPGMDAQQARRDTTLQTKTMRTNFSLMDALAANQQNGLRYGGNYYPDDTHLSVPLITEYDGLRFIFKPFTMPFSPKVLFRPNFKLDSAVVAHYQAATQQLGYEVLPPESLLAQWGQSLVHMGPGQTLKAGALFKLNVENYPQSYRAREVYGDYWVAQKDTAHALVEYKQSLGLKETPAVRKKLTSLQAKGAVASSPADKPKR